MRINLVTETSRSAAIDGFYTDSYDTRFASYSEHPILVTKPSDLVPEIIINALCWIRKVAVPVTGISSAAVSQEEIMENLDLNSSRK
jgi:hypothetical protein